MIYKLIIGALLLATILYYFFCFLEIFGVIKFTDKNTTVKIPQMFIPFYYLFKKDKPIEEPEEPKDYPITVYPGTVNLNSLINQVSISIVDSSYHGWSVDLPSWITLENNVGNGSKSILVTVKRNAGKNARTGEITITMLMRDTRTRKTWCLDRPTRSTVLPSSLVSSLPISTRVSSICTPHCQQVLDSISGKGWKVMKPLLSTKSSSLHR